MWSWKWFILYTCAHVWASLSVYRICNSSIPFVLKMGKTSIIIKMMENMWVAVNEDELIIDLKTPTSHNWARHTLLTSVLVLCFIWHWKWNEVSRLQQNAFLWLVFPILCGNIVHNHSCIVHTKIHNCVKCCRCLTLKIQFHSIKCEIWGAQTIQREGLSKTRFKFYCKIFKFFFLLTFS